jgi:hypothetical protein
MGEQNEQHFREATNEGVEMRIGKILAEEHDGFSGFTHWLIAICLFFCMWLIPWEFSLSFIHALHGNIIFTILIFFVIGGASLLADLDSSPLQGGGSTAVYQLGFLGQFLSIIAITISGVVWQVLHTKYDDKPESQHRLLWHAAVVPVCIYLWVYFCIPDSNSIHMSDQLSLKNTGLCMLFFFTGVSVYLGANMLLYKLLRLVGRQHASQFVCFILLLLSMWYMYGMTMHQVRLVGFAVAFGYLFHILADLITKGSAPVFFPIPVPKNGHLQLWRKPYILGYNLAITTGGAVNTILNFAFVIVDLGLFYILFVK